MRRWWFLAFLALPVSAGQEGDPLEPALKTIDEASMKRVLAELADDKYEGRRTGMAGIKKARQWMISQLNEWGVRPTPEGYELPWTGCANIGAVYEGSDPRLKDEWIVLGSHYDHLGRARRAEGEDDICNGADDNGSGSTVNMLIARALATSKIKLRRSILHLWFSGEEQGMNGSKAYRDKPVVPFEKIVAMLNCDMLGRPTDKGAELFGMGSSLQFLPAGKRALERVPTAKVNLVEAKGAYFHRSDQIIFWSKGVPVMFLFGAMHGDYHRVTDHADRIDYPKLTELAKFMLAMLVDLANHDGRIERNPDYQ